MQTQHTLAASGKTDEALLLAVLEGKLEAYGELYERYYPMARAIAFKHTSDINRVDDIVSESFARILQALKNGKGPHSYMGGYLSTTIAHLAGEYGLLAKKEVPSEQEHLEAMGTLDETVVQLHESDEVISAFTSLPERWQTVLWMSEIEAKKPREIAAAMDLTPNAVSALAIRAKESLKEGFLRAHQNAPATADCNRFSSHISPYVRGSLSQKRSDALRSHMETCNYCTSEYLSLVGINKSMRSWVFPVLAGLSIWTTDGSALIAPVAAASVGGTQSGSNATTSSAENASASSAFATGSNFSLLSPRSWGTPSQILAGAATLTAAVVAVVGGVAMSEPAHQDAQQITAEGFSTRIPDQKTQQTPSHKKTEKPSPLGRQFESNPFSGFSSDESIRSSDVPVLESLAQGLSQGSGEDLSALPTLVTASANEHVLKIAESALLASEDEQNALSSLAQATNNESLVAISSQSPSSEGRSAANDSSMADEGAVTSATGTPTGSSGEALADNPGNETAPRIVTEEAAPVAEAQNPPEAEAKVAAPVDTVPTDPLDPEVPVAPTKPVTPTDPTEPVTPTDPTEPVTPTDPTEPVTPTDPTEPVTPTDPTEPVTPTEPENPVIPVIPDNPGEVPQWYSGADFKAWSQAVPWHDFDQKNVATNKRCLIRYQDHGHTHVMYRYIPEKALNSIYTTYVLTAIYGVDHISYIQCR
ncbi:ESX-1 secretion associated protein EspK, Alanine and Proline rich [Mycobacteroides abscessus subsp. abscessus]|nr:ESX-1 secretion associated protein EspK, Alanine and Proline rich [Mycobacteroides abscessus subsp. abscessus]